MLFGEDEAFGTGSWSVLACQAHDQLRATVLDLPVVADIARKRVAAAGMSDRIDVINGGAPERGVETRITPVAANTEALSLPTGGCSGDCPHGK